MYFDSVRSNCNSLTSDQLEKQGSIIFVDSRVLRIFAKHIFPAKRTAEYLYRKVLSYQRFTEENTWLCMTVLIWFTLWGVYTVMKASPNVHSCILIRTYSCTDHTCLFVELEYPCSTMIAANSVNGCHICIIKYFASKLDPI